ncbi:hypothetical protein AKG33_01075 [Dichelobacter nodosus]|nr:hypothetical protein AKG33_01075 [Dichelobacter nodosus]
MTPAEKHKQAALVAAMQKEEVAQGSAYELMLDQLAQQKRELKNIKSREGKIALKQKILPQWSGYLDSQLTAKHPVQDEIIGQLLIWSIDVGDYEQALNIGSVMLTAKLSLPAHFERDLEDALTEEMSEAWLRSNELKPSLEHLLTLKQLVDEYDLFDEVRAKLYRALGEAEYEAGHEEAAMINLRTAISLNDKVGAKVLLNKLEKAHPETD